jgi:hypothetical protein
MQVPGVQDIKTVSEVAPDVIDQPLDLAFVVALTRSAEPVVEQVMALKLS